MSQDLATEAERSGFRATSSHAQVLALVDALAESSPLARRAILGHSEEGRELPLLVIADPPVADARQAAAAVAGGRVLVFAFANIHAGEVCGKESLLILARELLAKPDAPSHRAWLDRLVLVLAPIYNADGNERFGPENRPGQIGPDQMGTRANAHGLDLNRDSMKLESAEARAMARFLVQWDPQLILDLHTTNGSLHRYDLTWAPPLNPAGPEAPLALVRDQLLPQVAERLFLRTGRHTFAYGNFAGDHGRWETYSSLPRFGAQYHGLRGQLSVLSEAYSKIPFEQRVIVTREFVVEILNWTAEHADQVTAAFDEGRAQTIARGKLRGVRDQVGIRHALAKAAEPVTILGWVEPDGAQEAEHAEASGEPKDYQVEHWDHFEPVDFVERPLAYLVPAKLTTLLDVLERHGVSSHPLPAEADGVLLGLEIDRIEQVSRGGTAYLGHGTPEVTVQRRREERALDPADGWVLVPTAQPLGTLIVHLLEVEAEDALAPVLMASELRAGDDYAVLRVVDGPDALLWP